jgi:hypothetical protein
VADPAEVRAVGRLALGGVQPAAKIVVGHCHFGVSRLRVTPHSTRAHPDYAHSMNQTKLFFKPGKAGFVMGAALVLTLTGCVGYVDGPRGEVAVASPVVVVQDDYV